MTYYSRNACIFTTFIVLFILIAPAHSQTLKGKVVGIAEGVTITILDSNKRQHKIRLYGIDCPESGQPFGKEAKKHTAILVAGRQVSVEVYDMDRYGRTVGVVTADRRNVNRSLINNGYAWQYQKYCKASFCDEWLQIEKQVRADRIGLWRDSKITFSYPHLSLLERAAFFHFWVNVYG